MELTVNGDTTEVPDGITAAELVARFGLGRDGIAIAVNDAVLPRSVWDAPLLAYAEVQILTAVQGG